MITYLKHLRDFSSDAKTATKQWEEHPDYREKNLYVLVEQDFDEYPCVTGVYELTTVYTESL